MHPGARLRNDAYVRCGGCVVRITVAVKVVYSSYSANGEFKIGAVFTDLGAEVAAVLGRFAADA